MKEKLLDFLFPKSCINCGRFGEYVCDSCENKYFDRREFQQCHVCKKVIKAGFVHESCQEETNLDGVVVSLNYSKPIERLLGEMKYKLNFDVAGFIADYYKNAFQLFYGNWFQDFTFVPVPLYKKKEWKRGFNQTSLIAKHLAEHLILPNEKTLIRVRPTNTQVGLSRSEREENLQNAFKLPKDIKIRSKKIILVDDIMTTGTTLEECAEVLRVNRFTYVYAIVLTRG